MSEQLTTKRDIKSLINSDSMRDQFARALPKHLSPERFTRVAITALTRTPKLLDCTPESMMRCLLDLSAAGLEPDGRRAHLIPYGKEATLVIDYKGLVELAMRSGNVASIHADKVCKGDDFRVDRGTITKHEVNYLEPRGDAYAYYCLIRFKDGGEKSEVMTKDEVDAIRKRSRSGNAGPWVSDYDEMAKKTVFKRASKWIQLSPEIAAVLAHEDREDFAPRNVTPRPGLAAALLPKAEDSEIAALYADGKEDA